MLIHKVWGAITLAICLRSVVNATGICGNATIRKHWSDCRKFVECGVSSTIVFECPERSYFNPETLVCDFAMYAECVVDLEIDIQFFGEQRMLESTPGALISIDTCNDLPLGAKIQHPDYCNMFYHCSPSGPILFECPANLNFCPNRNVCNWPQFVDCSGSAVEPETNVCPGNCMPDNRCPIDCYKDLQTTVLPHPSKCNAFLRCRNGCACFETCDEGLYWSTRHGRCVERYRSECEEIERPECPEIICETDDRCPPLDDPKNPIRFPHPNRCDAYMQCFNGTACKVECPEELEFWEELGVCDIPWGCVPTPTTTTVITPSPTPSEGTTTEESTTESSTTESSTTVSSTTESSTTTSSTTESSTTESSTTVSSTTVSSTTASPTTASPTTASPTTASPTTASPTTASPTTASPTTASPTTASPTTAYPTTASPTTESPTTVSPTTVSPTTASPTTEITTERPPCPICPPGLCKPDDRCPIDICLECNPILLPHPDDCGMFLKCTHGYACEMQCPSGLHWSSAKNRCEWPANGDCAGGGATDDPPVGIGCPFDERCMLFDFYTDPLLLPYPDDCTKFVSCISSQHGCVKDCPSGLHWSVTLNRCEWPNRAGCDPTIPPIEDCPTCPCIPCRQRQDLHPCEENNYCSQNFNVSLSLPYQDNCSRFYKCLNGFACLLDCPDGTHYNSQSQHCVDPNQANCILN